MGRINSGSRSVCSETNITLIDNVRAEIENCRRILDCSDVCIHIRTVRTDVMIWGENLSVSDFKTGGLIVEGRIHSVEFDSSGGERN